MAAACMVMWSAVYLARPAEEEDFDLVANLRTGGQWSFRKWVLFSLRPNGEALLDDLGSGWGACLR